MQRKYIEDLNLLVSIDTLNHIELKKIENIINELEISDQLSLHGYLSFNTLQFLCSNRVSLNISNDVKDHLVWSYYDKLTSEKTIIDEKLFNEILNEYQIKQSESIVSIVVELIKKEKIYLHQIDEIAKCSKSPELQKQIFEYKIKNAVKNGQIIDHDSIKKLFMLRAYETLKFIVDNGHLTTRAYSEFLEPKEGEMDKRWKRLLYQLASKKEKID